VKIIVTVATLLVVAVSPATADPITAPQAVTELTAAIEATNNADAYTFTDAQTGETARFNRTAGEYEQQGFDTFKTFSATGTYYQIKWPSTAVRTKVLSPRYLNNPSLEWELVTGPLGALEIPLWPDLLDVTGERRGLIYFPPREADITYADKTALPGGNRYVIGNGFYEDVYTVDLAGRVVRLETTRSAGSAVTGHLKTWDYVAVTVTPPATGTFLPYATVQRAIEAATLDKTLRSLARTTASSNRGRSLARMRVMARERVSIYNAGGEDEQIPVYVKLRIRNVPGGVRIFRTNPITDTFHEWRIIRGPNWRAVRTAP
jgi:hypothetical protein